MLKQGFSQKHRGIVTSLTLLIILGFSFTSIPLWFVSSSHMVLERENNNIDKTIDVSLVDRPNEFIGAGDIPWSIITIDDDGDFESQGWLGDGSSSNPYRIENLSINAASANNRIKVWNTRAHFLIKNCSLTGATGSEYAIQLLNVTNAVVTDNDIFGNPSSIEIINSTDVIFINNTCSQTITGISVRSNAAPTYNVQILNNTLTSGQDGMRGYDNNELTIADNHVSGFSNLGIYFYSSESVSIINNTCTNTGAVGIYVEDDVSDCIIFGNTVSTCLSGIHVEDTTFVVANNSVSICTNGIYFDETDNNLVENNTIFGNDNGIILNTYSDGNDIIWNFLEGNTVQVEDNGGNNNIRNNYYGDHTGLDTNGDGITDNTYAIAGTSSNVDPYPLFDKDIVRQGLQWTQIPAHQMYELGDSFTYDLNTTSTVGVDWWMNWDSLWIIDSNGIITNVTDGFNPTNPSREVHVIVTNFHARSIEAYFNITIQDTIAPVWVEQPESVYYWDQGQSFYRNFDVYDLAVEFGYVGELWINDTIHFYLDPDGISTSVTGNVSTITFGSYGLEVVYTDQSDNSVSAEFTVIYRDNTGPMFDDVPDPLTFTEGDTDVVTLTWVFSDLNPSSYELRLDGDVIASGIWDESPETIDEVINIDTLSVGTHIYLMTITDIAGNTDTHETIIIIEPSLDTTTTTSEPPPTPLPIETIILLASLGGIVLVVVIVIMKKRG